MIYRFNKEIFNKNADKYTKKIFSKHKDHLDCINGLEVNFKENDRFGTIEEYELNGEKYYLYPVYKEWCSTEEQLSLI